jgi:hypothetical protein
VDGQGVMMGMVMANACPCSNRSHKQFQQRTRVILEWPIGAFGAKAFVVFAIFLTSFLSGINYVSAREKAFRCKSLYGRNSLFLMVDLMPEAYGDYHAENHAARHAAVTGADPLATGLPSNVGWADAQGVAESFSRSDHVHNRVYPIDRLAGVLGVASVWTVNPTNLERCTDGNWGNMTGEGSKAVAGWTEAGRIVFDMGAVYNVFVRAKVRLRNNIVAGDNVVFNLSGSEDGIIYYQNLTGGNATATRYVINSFGDIYIEGFVRGRYLRLSWESNVNAGTIGGAVWEIQAIDLGI